MQSKAELLEKIQQGREQMESAFARVGDERMLEPALEGGWTPKDMLAHLGWWEHRVTRLYDALSNGRLPDSIHDGLELEDLNAKVYNDHRDMPLDEVRRFERDGYEKVLALAEGAPEDDLFNPQRFAWTEGDPFYGWIEGNTYGHYEEHVEALLAWLDGKLGAPGR